MINDLTVMAEKYRPKNLDEVIGQSHIIPLLKGFIKNKDIPHMIFSGLPGTGKTTVAKAIARDFYGNEWKNYFLEMNASDSRKLDDVRNIIKPSAQIKIIGQQFKIIFMDEADSIDKLGQNALRRVIEDNSDRCRFILSCNWPNKIIDPIIDRCVVFRFKPIKTDDMIPLLKKIVQDEGIDITASAISVLATLSNGSMRRALNTLHILKSGDVKDINDETIYQITGYVNDDHVRSFLVAVEKGDLNKTDDYMDKLLNTKVYAPQEILESLRRLIKDSKILSMEAKLLALSKIGDIEFRISEGASPDIQLKTYAVYLLQQYKKYVKV